MIVDDHTLVREGTQAILATYSDIDVVGVAGDAAEAERLLIESAPDVLLLDIRLPDASGVDVARFVRRARPDTAILVMTGYDDVAYVRTLFELGVRGYLRKTASSQQIVAAIRAVAAGHVILGAEIVHASPGAETDRLSDREREVMRLIALGRRNAEIARELGVSIKTVEFHVGNVLDKLGVRSRVEALARARQLGYPVD